MTQMTFYRYCWWLAYALVVCAFRLRVEGRHHIPQSGAAILAANHCSLVDPVMIGVATGRELWYLAKAEVFPIPVLGKLIRKLHAMPVDRRRGDRSALLIWTKVLQSGDPVLIFPEGTRNKGPGFLRPKAGVGMLVYRTQAPVIPVYISGTVNIWKTMLGLGRLQVRFGEPIQFCPEQLPDKRRDAYHFISHEVMRHLAVLERMRRKAGTVAPASRSGSPRGVGTV